MSKVRQWLAISYLLLPSLACSGIGLKVLVWAKATSNPAGARWGMVLLFGGMTIVPLLLWIFGNLFIFSERARFNASRKDRRLSDPRNIRRLETAVRNMRFLERHPNAAPLFCLVGLIVGVVLMITPASTTGNSSINGNVGRIISGGGIGLAYLIATVLCIHVRVTGRWNFYIRKAVELTEERLERARRAAEFKADQ